MKHATWYRLRGNANGRTPAYWQREFFCEGCQKMHGMNVVRWGIGEKLYCTRQYNKILAAQAKSGKTVLGLIE